MKWISRATIQDTREGSVHSNNRARLDALCNMAETLIEIQEWIENELDAVEVDGSETRDDKMWLKGNKASLRRLKQFIDKEAAK